MPDPRRGSEPDRRVAASLVRWFRATARDLPWRTTPRDPYRSMVSEFMLQQTQVSRVVTRFASFIERFPTIGALAKASDDDVRSEWAGLGYYRRASLLHAAARAIVNEHDGVVPRDPDMLRELPGFGAYTTGAIASMVYNAREPAVDGNVIRVMMRLDNARGTSQRGKPAATAHAMSLMQITAAPAVLAEAIMELGATVCTPASPKCDRCPISRDCGARRAGRQNDVPEATRRAVRRRLYSAGIVCRDSDGLVLIEQRPTGGLWGGLWQLPSIDRADRQPTPAELAKFAGVRSVRHIASVERVLTHRDVTLSGSAAARITARNKARLTTPVRRWVRDREIGLVALSSAHRALFEATGMIRPALVRGSSVR